MFYIKRRIIDIELKKIVVRPYIKTLSNKKVVCYMRALVSLQDFRSFENCIFNANLYLVDMIAPPYTLPLWRYLYKKTKNIKKHCELDFIKLYGYMYKPNKDSIAFYVVDATERKLPKEKRLIAKSEEQELGAYSLNSYYSYFEGEEYLKEKYPLLNDENNKIKAFLYKGTTPHRIYYYKSLEEKITIYLFDDNLYRLVNPNQKEELKGKPLFYQLLNTMADTPSIAEELGGSSGTIRVLLSRRTFKAQKPKNTKAKKHKKKGERV